MRQIYIKIKKNIINSIPKKFKKFTKEKKNTKKMTRKRHKLIIFLKN